ncbi:MAG: ATP-dependent DNA helicase [Methanoregula sp.]|uniref:ATP-dependent DNA helicase n=1 Tax=Methanoregula sp. TaxID=2052170 RepID=UPI0025F36CE9|nr:ATP-dependent DNA helicase [Methanoregula sp.]MCK9631602.1 ATP-dependent DNA helicase [Methanoregula sp.]
MQINGLPVPENLKQHYMAAGVLELYPPQAQCVEKGMFDGRNLLVAIPTASGKTLVAEMAMHHHIARKGKCLYIVPLKALASEKYDEFSNKGVRVGIATGDFDRRDDQLGRNDIIVATSEKVDSLLRNNARWISEISLLVVDEVHLIDSPNRGPVVEMVIAKLRYRNPAMQVIGLSATIGNPQVLAGWLDAELVTSTWRPVDLRQGVFCKDRIHFRDGERAVKAVSKNYDDLNLCLDTIAEGGQCLVFVSSRRNAEAFAKRAAGAIKSEEPELKTYASQLEKTAETEMGKTLAACVSQGAAFHHAGLSRPERAIIEEGFRKGLIKSISSTPTLAAGLNLPARRVIIRDYHRFTAGEGMQPIPASEYHQMAGRAGRPRLDPYGEAVLIAKDEGQVEELFDWYIEAPPEEIHSKIAEPNALYTHVLSLIASGFAGTRGELASFMDRSYYVHEHRQGRLMKRAVDAALKFLTGAELVLEVGDHLASTEFGTLVSRLYIDPRSAAMIVTTLRTRSEYADLGLLHLICSTPDMPKLYVRNTDRCALDRMIEAHEDELWLTVPCEEEDQEDYYRALKTAMLLNNWADELPDAKICERYSVGPGDVYGMVESVNWLLHASGELSRMFAGNFHTQIREYEICMKNGIRRELLPLVKLRGIGRVRARRLFNNTITSPEAVLAAGIETVTTLIGHGIAEQVFAQLERGGKKTSGQPAGEDDMPGQSTLSRFG